MTRIILLRHGRSVANIAQRFAGHVDAPLAPLGEQQAREAAEWLCKNEKIDRIYASDLQRAMNTARPTAERLGLEITPEPAFREVNAGLWENVEYEEIQVRFADGWQKWRGKLSLARPDGGESVAEVYARVVKALHRVAAENDGKTVLIASHWTPLRCAIAHAMGYRVEDILQAPAPYNAAISIIRYENGVFSPEEINITAHLSGSPTTPNA